MSNVEAGIFFEQLVQDLENGSLTRKSEIIKFFNKYNLNANPTKTKLMQNWINASLLTACENGHVNVVDFLLTSKDLPILADINAYDGKILYKTAEKGNLEVIKYLLTSPNLKTNVDIHTKDDVLLTAASNGGHFNLIKYLLTSPELKEHANIHAKEENALVSACATRKYEIVKYLLSSPDLKEHSNIHVAKDLSFSLIMRENNTEMLQYLIFDLKIEITDNIKEIVENCFDSERKEQIKNWIKIRQFNDLLEDLPVSENKKNNKVKM